MKLSAPALVGCLFLVFSKQMAARDTHRTPAGESDAAAGSADGIISTPKRAPGSPAGATLEPSQPGVNVSGLLKQSLLFLGIQHSFRLATEAGTREGLRGPFLRNYGRAVKSMHGWADGDEFYVNYIGHPMMGAIAGRIWAQNDRRFLDVEFGRDPEYWRSRLRAAAFSYLYSLQFEIGPVSEASIGRVQEYWPAQGYVDHVVTPIIGIGWMIAEDALDKHVVQRLEAKTGNGWLRLLVRGWLNPTRSLSNMVRGKEPWYRDTRAGVYLPYSYVTRRSSAEPRPRRDLPPDTGLAPFEFTMTFQPQYNLSSAGNLCLGGAGEGAIRIAPAWQVVFGMDGCKMTGLERDLSGDSLRYFAGPRWRSYNAGRWSHHVQVTVGGQQLTQERMLWDKWRELEPLVKADPKPYSLRPDYTQQAGTHGFSLAAGGGVDYKLSRALALRVASLEYRHSWVDRLNGISYDSGLHFTTGLVLRMGVW
ncbi:MAG: hypothetical protein HY235_06040 [Acidobacteria bacterium]|nr:hypothetical protein [Acidobacteriota bacterium]